MLAAPGPPWPGGPSAQHWLPEARAEDGPPTAFPRGARRPGVPRSCPAPASPPPLQLCSRKVTVLQQAALSPGYPPASSGGSESIAGGPCCVLTESGVAWARVAVKDPQGAPARAAACRPALRAGHAAAPGALGSARGPVTKARLGSACGPAGGYQSSGLLPGVRAAEDAQCCTEAP